MTTPSFDREISAGQAEWHRQGVDPPGPPGSGWVTFAGFMLTLGGILNCIAGLGAIFDSRIFADEAVFIFSDLNTWGWIILLLGVAQLIAAAALLNGSQFARWFAMATAGLNAIGQLMFVDSHPFWALAVFTIDLLIIYGLAVYGGSRTRAA